MKGDKPTPPLPKLSLPSSWRSAAPVDAIVMAGGRKPALQFRDAGDYALIDLTDLNTAVQASFSGDSVHVRSTDGAKDTILEVLQLYSTIDPEHSRLEILDHGVRLHLRKLEPSEAWPQLTAPDTIQAPEESPANALQERQAVERLMKAAQAGNVEAFDSSALHFGSNDLSSVKDGNDRNALHFAAASGQPDFCRYLLTEKGFPVDAQDSTGQPALAYAAGRGDLTCIEILLELGSNAALPNGTGGPQAIHRAAASGNINVAELLLEHGADINAGSSAGPPLFLAAGHQEEDMAAFLIGRGADVDATDDKGVSACLLAAATGAEQLLEKLICGGTNVNKAASGGVTPLHVAAERGNTAVVHSLLKAGADPDAKDQEGARPIDSAAAAQEKAVVELLLPRTSPGTDHEWTVDALMLHAASQAQHQHQHDSCCGCGHEHGYEEVQVDIPDAEEPDEAKAAKMKRQGDEAFVKGYFGRAAEAYTQALRHNTSDPAVWANRSAAFLRTGAAEDALQDARRARTLKPDYAKAHYREGSALQAMESWEAAAQAYFQGFRMDPQNTALAQAFQHAIHKAREEHAAAQKSS